MGSIASLSEKLRRERELRGVSLKQISDDTKIGVRFLEALEEGALDRIPGEFYRRSYLRAYARYLGLDEDRAVNAYNYSKVETGNGASGVEEDANDGPAWLRFWLAAAVVAVPLLLFLRPQADTTPPGEAERSAVEGDRAATPPEVAGTLSTATTPTAPPAPEGDEDEDEGEGGGPASARQMPTFPTPRSEVAAAAPEIPIVADIANGMSFVLAIEEACWLEVMADGEVVVSGLKEVGYRRQFTARDEVRLWLGNAGGVRLWVNGQSVRPLGESGQVRKDVMITKSNLTEFVSAPSDAP